MQGVGVSVGVLLSTSIAAVHSEAQGKSVSSLCCERSGLCQILLQGRLAVPGLAASMLENQPREHQDTAARDC